MLPALTSDGGALDAGLEEALAYWRGEEQWTGQRRGAGDGSPPAGQLLAAERIVLGLLKALQDVDPRNQCGYQDPVGALYRALFDLIEGNNPPEWIRPRKIQDRSVDGVGLWEVRMTAAQILDYLMRVGIQRTKAQQMVFDVLQRHGVRVQSAKSVYRWLRSCRESNGSAPQNIKETFKATLKGNSLVEECPESIVNCLLDVLAKTLAARGHLPNR